MPVFMVRPLALAALAALALATAPCGMAAAQALPQPREERMEDQPNLPGREETFTLCATCHAYKLVSNQGMNRERWDETLSWMTERHSMPPLEGDERKLVLDYLTKAHPLKADRGGFKNPFLD